MGYKHKATMYYSDDETHAFLQDKAAKPNGNKSASQYLYSLVTRERENAVSAESQQNVTCMVRMYPQYTRIQWRQFSGPLSCPAVTGIGKNKTAQTRLLRKDLMEAIDREIYKDSGSDADVVLLYPFGFWLLAFGFWLLAFGFWLLAFECRYGKD